MVRKAKVRISPTAFDSYEAYQQDRLEREPRYWKFLRVTGEAVAKAYHSGLNIVVTGGLFAGAYFAIKAGINGSKDVYAWKQGGTMEVGSGLTSVGSTNCEIAYQGQTNGTFKFLDQGYEWVRTYAAYPQGTYNIQQGGSFVSNEYGCSDLKFQLNGINQANGKADITWFQHVMIHAGTQDPLFILGGLAIAGGCVAAYFAIRRLLRDD